MTPQTQRVSTRRTARRLRVGVVNLMPRAETYEPLIARALGPEVELAWIRLSTHGYSSSDPARIAARYERYDRALARGPLDGLLLTGAPVETLPFSEVRYWDELSEVLSDARRRVRSTLGICWGAMALAKTLGVEKTTLPRKVFGSFEHELTPAGRAMLPGLDGTYRCAQSRFATLREVELDLAERDGRLTRLALATETGTTLLATPDRSVVMHLGHPEYEPARVAYEWSRDRVAARSDVDAPRGFDADVATPTLPWERDSRAFFRAWRASLATASARAEAP